MSDTPETDALIKNVGDGAYIAYLVNFARKLERERNSLKIQLEQLRDAYEDLCDLHFENLKGN